MAKITGLHAFMIKEQFRHVFEELGYAFFGLESKKAWNVNIIGVRAERHSTNLFDDMLVVIYRNTKKDWEVRTYPITTDPGEWYLENPMNSKGTAILVPGQYRSVYKIDLHGGRYEALCQRNGEVSVFRDPNKDNIADTDAASIASGYFGINIHRSRKSGEAEQVDRWSAGCQVFKSASDWKDFMSLMHRSAKYFGNSFTYSLINEGDILDGTYRRFE